MSNGAVPSTASLRSIRRVITFSETPSRSRSSLHACAIAASSARFAGSPSSAVNAQGRVWCGAGAVQAARTASSTASRDTAPGPKARMVRRAEIDRSGDSRNRSSSAGRTSSAAGEAGAFVSTPRTIAAGTCEALPMTSPLAAATSSARATIVAPKVKQGGKPRASDGHVHHSTPPRAAEGIGDHHPDGDPEGLFEALADRLRRPVRVLRKEGQESRFDVRCIHARVGAHEAVPGLGDHEVPPPSHDAAGFSFGPRCPALAPVRNDPALGLRHDLLSNRDDVAMPDAELREFGPEECGDIVAGTDLSEALDGDDLDAHAQRTRWRAVRATFSAFAASAMTVSVTATRTPSSRSMRDASSRSA